MIATFSMLCALAIGPVQTAEAGIRPKAIQSIAVPANATSANRAAAGKLAEILEKMSGRRLPVVSEAIAAKPAIFVGACTSMPAAMQDDLAKAKKWSSLVAIEVDEIGNVWIAGENDWGHWWTVGHFLFLEGFRWFIPHPYGMEHPTNHPLTFSKRSLRHESPFRHRGNIWQTSHLEHVYDWRALNGLWIGHHSQTIESRFGKWPAELGGGHFEESLLTRKLFADHPEWFALVKGKRQPSHFDYSTPQVLEFVAGRLAEQIEHAERGGALCESFLFGPADGMGFSESPEAKAVGDVSENWFRFVQRLADELGDRKPGFRLHALAYDGYPNPPKNTRLKDNVVIWITQWPSLGVSDVHHPTMDPNGPNKPFFDRAKRWKESAPGGIRFYTYWGDWKSFTPYPMVRNICHDMPRFAQFGAEGIVNESHAHWGTNALSLWAIVRLMWNPSLSEQALLDDWSEKFWGPAGQPMKRFYQELQSAFNARRGVARGDLSEEMIARGNALMSAAEREIKGTAERFHWRFRITQAGWEHSVRYCRANRENDRLANERNRPDANAAEIDAAIFRQIQVLKETLAFARTDFGQWVFSPSVSIDRLERDINRHSGTLRGILPEN